MEIRDTAVGVLVKLKSGGPTMTVIAVEVDEDSGTDNVTCAWFTAEGVSHEADFPSQALVKAD